MSLQSLSAQQVLGGAVCVQPEFTRPAFVQASVVQALPSLQSVTLLQQVGLSLTGQQTPLDPETLQP